jgi:hypothetical protein
LLRAHQASKKSYQLKGPPLKTLQSCAGCAILEKSAPATEALSRPERRQVVIEKIFFPVADVELLQDEH